MRDANDQSVPFAAMFRLRSGGWVLLLALLIGILIIVFTLAPALQRIASRPPGDGRTPGSYGFVLEPSSIPAAEFVPAQLHRDMASPLVDPPPITPAAIEQWAQENRGKYLVSSDPVVGVVIDGVPRAYPLGWMAFHEVANDVLADVPLLVVMHPLSRTIAVYRRQAGDRLIEFGTSGLMRDSTMLLYARERDADGELVIGGPEQTLWDPRTGSALTGPDLEAGRVLERVPFVLTHYGDWRRQHPGTTVMSRRDDLLERYKKATFDRYWAEDSLLYPVTTEAPTPPRRLEACVVLPGSGDAADVVIPASWIDANATRPAAPEEAATEDAAAEGAGGDAGGPAAGVRTWWIDVDGRRIGLQYRDEPETITAVAADGGPVEQVHSAWFSWWSTGHRLRLPTSPRAIPMAEGLTTFDASADDAAAAAADDAPDDPANVGPNGA